MIKLSEIVHNFMEPEDLPDSMYGRLYSMAIRGYRQVHYHAIGSPKVAKLSCSASNVYDLPDDLLQIIRIGPENGNGEIQSLTRSSIINTYEKTKCDENDTEANLNKEYGWDYSFFGTIGYFGLSASDSLGSYSYNREDNTVIISGGQGNSVFVEYLPFSDCCDDYLVDPFFQETLISWLRWQYSLSNKRSNTYERRENERLFYNDLRIAKRSVKPFDPAQAYKAYYSTTRLARF